MRDDEFYMRAAISEAKRAGKKGEVPVGAVIVRGDKIVGRGHNTRETKRNALNHAELIAINRACKKLRQWRLLDCVMYVTLEPCVMCHGGIINARIKRVVFGAQDAKAGAMGSLLDLGEYSFNHKTEVVPGVLAEESKKLLQDFFAELRNRKK